MQYCKKHDQEFMDHVPGCPTCFGITIKCGERVFSPSQEGYKKPKEVKPKKPKVLKKETIKKMIKKPKSKFKRKTLKPFI